MHEPHVADLATMNIGLVGPRTRLMWRLIEGNRPLYDGLIAGIVDHISVWPSVRGSMLIPGYNRERDAEALAVEGARALVMNAAARGMIPLPSPVTEAMQGALLSVHLVQTLDSMKIRVAYSPGDAAELPAYNRGGQTDLLYARAFDFEQPRMFWVDQVVLNVRLERLEEALEAYGIAPGRAVSPLAYRRYVE
jgi:hypothetical protein